MKPGMLLLCGLAVAGCKKKDEAKPAAGSAAAPVGAGSVGGSGSAAAVVIAPGVLAFDTRTPDPESPDAVAVAFDGKVPRLPAISPDGTLFADYRDLMTGGPMPPPYPMDIALRKVNGVEATSLDLYTGSDYEAVSEEDHVEKWLTPSLSKTLHARAAAALQRLAGFQSLDPVKIDEDNEGNPQPAKVGDLVFTTDDSGDGLGLELRDAHGRVLQRDEVEGYRTGDDMTGCGYTPRLEAVHRDPRTGMLYVEVGYRYRDDCDEPLHHLFGWSSDPAKADPAAEAHGVVAQQFQAAVGESPAVTNNQLVTTTALAPFAAKAKPVVASNVDLTLSNDGKSAWGSARGTKDRELWRATDLLVQTPKGWQLAAVAWTEPKDNAAVNRDAKAGKLVAGTLAGDPGDQGLRDAFAKLTTDGLPSVRKDLVAIGSGPDERTVDGPAFAKAWNAVWKGKTTIVSSVAHATPSGTTGWVAATVELQKTGYKIPFTVFAVFDKDAAGQWTLATIHFSV